jgi:cytochrome o ubiquinol oxidase operon protein cyoD
MSQAPIDSVGASRGTLAWSPAATLAAIFGAGIVQILVHLHYFLHLDTTSAARWNVVALMFTLLIMALFVGGTIWIMHSLYYRMM